MLTADDREAIIELIRSAVTDTERQTEIPVLTITRPGAPSPRSNLGNWRSGPGSAEVPAYSSSLWSALSEPVWCHTKP